MTPEVPFRPTRRTFLGMTGATAAAAALGGAIPARAGTRAATQASAAAYVWITWLGDVLRDGGCTVIEQSGWTTRGRPSSSGNFNPSGVLLHHTAGGTNATSSNPAPTLSTVINGRPDLVGPLCHVLLDYNGACRLIAAGRANHAGEARASGPMPAGDGNALYIGIEIDYNATGVDAGQRPSSAQREGAIAASAALCKHLGVAASHVRGHRETSVTGKIDPSYFDLDAVRSEVASRI